MAYNDDLRDFDETMVTPGSIMYMNLKKLVGRITEDEMKLAAEQAITEWLVQNPSPPGQIVDPTTVKSEVDAYLSENWEQFVGPTGAKGKDGKSATMPDDNYLIQLISDVIGAYPENFVGPEGLQGLKGEQGETGPPVDPTIVNNTLRDLFFAYFDSLRGPKGNEGLKGDKGDQGDRGLKGEDGVSVNQSQVNATLDFLFNQHFENLRGPQGVKGNDGLKGDKGDKGNTGDKGLDGTSADPAQVANQVSSLFYQNTANLKGAKGDKGDTGLTGLQGLQGEQGTRGMQGLQGEQGVKGDKGNPTVLRTGELKLPLLALGIPYDATVSLSGAMLTTSYNVEILKGATLLGAATAVVKTKNLSSVVLTITPGVLVSAGAAIMVLCYE